MKSKFILIYSIALLLLLSCTEKKEKNFVVIGIPSDIETINPLYSFSVEEGDITDLMFLALLESNWNFEKGEIEYKPMLAKKWHWEDNKEALVVELRDDVYWSDGIKCTIDDVIFSFDIYSDKRLQSRAYGFFEKLETDESGHVITEKVFEKLGNNKLKIKFKKNSLPSLLEIDYPILPKHFFEKYNREEIPTVSMADSIVTNGAYTLDRWEKGTSIILKQNKNSFLISPNSVSKIVFKIIPEYQNRLNQLAYNEIDIMEDIKADDMEELGNNDMLKIVPISGRELEYIGWNNISPKKFANGKIISNKYFGSVKVRQALTHAFNRAIVINEYLNGYGQLATTPLSPIFTMFYDSSIKPYDYNPKKAKALLSEEGWIDHNGDGTIDKDGIEFKFTLHIPSGNPRREFAASLYQNNLKAIGIDMQIESNELGVFIDNLRARQYDAWMAIWVVPIPLNLQISWYSDLDNTPFNIAAYQNKKLDILLDKLNNIDLKEKVKVYKDIQNILYHDQPYTFLYWIDNITSYNKRIKNIEVTPLGAVKHCWNWKLN